MKTKQIPAMVTLFAAFVMCIISYVNDFSLSYFILISFFVLLGFFVLGVIIKIILDMSVSKLDEEFISADDLGFTDGEIIEDMEFIEEDQEA